VGDAARVAVTTLVLLVAASCGGGDAASEPDPGAVQSAECGPRAITHRYGTTEVRGLPGRIVPMSVRDQDTLLALGVLPVALQDGHYRRPYTSWPWVPGRVADAELAVLPAGQVNYEQIAALRPDLIVASGAALTGREYEILSRMAPTVAHSGEHVEYGVPWQELARTVGRLVCRRERAEALIAELEARFAQVRRRYPSLQGAVGVVGMPGAPGGANWAYGPEDSRTRLLTLLGMDHPRELARLARDRFVATVSAERLDLFDGDVLVWLATPAQRAALEQNPVYRELEVVREGRVLYVEPDGVLTAALTNTTPLNLPYLLETFVPRLAAAAAGRRPDPSRAPPVPGRAGDGTGAAHDGQTHGS